MCSTRCTKGEEETSLADPHRGEERSLSSDHTGNAKRDVALFGRCEGLHREIRGYSSRKKKRTPSPTRWIHKEEQTEHAPSLKEGFNTVGREQKSSKRENFKTSGKGMGGSRGHDQVGNLYTPASEREKRRGDDSRKQGRSNHSLHRRGKAVCPAPKEFDSHIRK